MKLLIDHNIEKHGKMLSEVLTGQGWTEFVPTAVVTFQMLQLPTDSDDRLVWRTAQKNKLILLTANRRMIGNNSLEQVLREENTASSLPVVTIASADRFLLSVDYRDLCVDKLISILLDIDNLLGTKRLFLP